MQLHSPETNTALILVVLVVTDINKHMWIFFFLLFFDISDLDLDVGTIFLPWNLRINLIPTLPITSSWIDGYVINFFVDYPYNFNLI